MFFGSSTSFGDTFHHLQQQTNHLLKNASHKKNDTMIQNHRKWETHKRREKTELHKQGDTKESFLDKNLKLEGRKGGGRNNGDLIIRGLADGEFQAGVTAALILTIAVVVSHTLLWGTTVTSCACGTDWRALASWLCGEEEEKDVNRTKETMD